MSIPIQFLDYIKESFIHIWPFLLLTIPISVAINISGIGNKINFAFTKKPAISILLATAIGAFSPLCSCSVVPVIATLIISGVPLGPVMAFWLASPSMDIEIFSLTVATLGTNLAVWRLISTFLLSLTAGFITHYLQINGLFGNAILKSKNKQLIPITKTITSPSFHHKETGAIKIKFENASKTNPLPMPEISDSALCCNPIQNSKAIVRDCGTGTCKIESVSKWDALINETLSATTMVIKFMLLAFSIGALIHIFMPTNLVSQWVGNNNPSAILIASLLGIPIYTSNLTAMPMIGELLSQGMNPAAALAFLIAGPITTLPAMSAVWGLVSRRVFALYIGFGMIGAIIFGYFYNIFL